MNGFFVLSRPEDLLKKLRHDFEAFEKRPSDVYLAFNFFVTAEHLLDWVYPGNANKKQRTAERQNNVALQVCSHLASGAKHFRVEASHHCSVKEATRKVGAGFGGTTLGTALIHAGGPSLPTGSTLSLRLEGKAATAFGQDVAVLALAKAIMHHWENHEKLNRSNI